MCSDETALSCLQCLKISIPFRFCEESMMLRDSCFWNFFLSSFCVFLSDAVQLINSLLY